MPDPNAVHDAQSRREARHAARAAEKTGQNRVADQQDQDIAALSELQSLANRVNSAKTAKPAPKTRSERKEQARKAAEAQAEADVRVEPKQYEDIAGEIAKYRDRGEQPPLHLLNLQAKANSTAIKDEAREIANAAGRAAFAEAVGRRPERSRHTRFRRMTEAAKAAQAAAPKENAE
jgi:hypothetical protein